MADEKKKPSVKVTHAPAPSLRPNMSDHDIRQQGVRIDVPYEAGSSDPQPLAYADGQTLEQSHPELVDPDWDGS